MLLNWRTSLRETSVSATSLLTTTYSITEFRILRHQIAQASDAVRLEHIRVVWRIINEISSREFKQYRSVYNENPRDTIQACETYYGDALRSNCALEGSPRYEFVVPAVVKFDTNPITLDELSRALSRMHIGKASGPDGAPVEALRLPAVLPTLL